MKKILVALVVLGFLGGCAAGMGAKVPGQLWATVKTPMEGPAAAGDLKQGTAVCETVLGLVAWGDCSVMAAKRAGGLTSVQYVDQEVKNILGVYATYTTVVRGQ